MNKIINLPATMQKAGRHYTKAFISDELTVTWETVNNWFKGKKIPKKSHERLCNLFERNGIEPVYIEESI